jgi:hypothetical protein
MQQSFGRHLLEVGVSVQDAFPSTYTYNGDGTVATITVAVDGANYKKTYTYVASQLTQTTGWVKQ